MRKRPKHVSQPKGRQCGNCGKPFSSARRVFCTPECRVEAMRRLGEHERKPIENDFLPADDEANIEGFWVPSPEEIDRVKTAIRRGEVDVRA